MRVVSPDDNDQEDDEGINIDLDDVLTEELEAVAYRFTQIIPDRCEEIAKITAQGGVNHPVVFLIDVADPFGLAIARKVNVLSVINQALKETEMDARPGVISVISLYEIESKEPSIFYAIRDRMTGLIGYFPIVVAAKGGFTVFPWPFKLKEKSKFKLFPP